MYGPDNHTWVQIVFVWLQLGWSCLPQWNWIEPKMQAQTLPIWHSRQVWWNAFNYLTKKQLVCWGEVKWIPAIELISPFPLPRLNVLLLHNKLLYCCHWLRVSVAGQPLCDWQMEEAGPTLGEMTFVCHNWPLKVYWTPLTYLFIRTSDWFTAEFHRLGTGGTSKGMTFGKA